MGVPCQTESFEPVAQDFFDTPLTPDTIILTRLTDSTLWSTPLLMSNISPPPLPSPVVLQSYEFSVELPGCEPFHCRATRYDNGNSYGEYLLPDGTWQTATLSTNSDLKLTEFDVEWHLKENCGLKDAESSDDEE
jgi:hypothetical protein